MPLVINISLNIGFDHLSVPFTTEITDLRRSLNDKTWVVCPVGTAEIAVKFIFIAWSCLHIRNETFPLCLRSEEPWISEAGR